MMVVLLFISCDAKVVSALRCQTCVSPLLLIHASATCMGYAVLERM